MWPNVLPQPGRLRTQPQSLIRTDPNSNRSATAKRSASMRENAHGRDYSPRSMKAARPGGPSRLPQVRLPDENRRRNRGSRRDPPYSQPHSEDRPRPARIRSGYPALNASCFPLPSLWERYTPVPPRSCPIQPKQPRTPPSAAPISVVRLRTRTSFVFRGARVVRNRRIFVSNLRPAR